MLVIVSVRHLLLLLLCLSALRTLAQDNAIPGIKMATAPKIDGVVDAEEWKDAPAVRGLVDENNAAPSPEDAEFRIGYDDKYIYFAAKLLDSQPGSIRANEYRTNVSLSGDDSVSLYLDLSGSLTDWNAFGINPRGATSIDLAGGRAAKREWTGEFVAAARTTPEGWEAEARIPWQVMRLPAAGPRTVRVNFARAMSRTQRSYIWRYYNAGQSQNNGRWLDVEIPKSPADRSILLLPYLYTGVDQKDGPIANGGLDLKTNLADQVVLVGSINPDFRNIENAILSLDFSRFERLAGESRPFFLEGRQYYNSAIFASQRIRSFDLGVNVYGRASDRTSFGVLDAADFGGQNAFVGNFSYDPDPKNSIRMTATSLKREGFDNEGYLLRYSRQIGDINLFLRTMGTQDEVRGAGTHNTGMLVYERGGLFTYAAWEAVAPTFLPRLGFQPERDYKGIQLGGGYNGPVHFGSIREVSVDVNTNDYDFFDGGFYRNEQDVQASFALIDGTSIGLGLNNQDFMGSHDRLYSVSLTRPRNSPARNARIAAQWGQIGGVYFESTGASLAYRPVQRMQVTASYQHVHHASRSDLGILGLNYDLGNDLYLSGRAVKRDDDWNAYLSFRRSGARGVEYFLILGDPNARTFKSSLILKMVMPFAIR